MAKKVFKILAKALKAQEYDGLLNKRCGCACHCVNVKSGDTAHCINEDCRGGYLGEFEDTQVSGNEYISFEGGDAYMFFKNPKSKYKGLYEAGKKAFKAMAPDDSAPDLPKPLFTEVSNVVCSLGKVEVVYRFRDTTPTEFDTVQTFITMLPGRLFPSVACDIICENDTSDTYLLKITGYTEEVRRVYNLLGLLFVPVINVSWSAGSKIFDL